MNEPPLPPLPGFLTAPSGSGLPVPRLLLVLAHPDDEVLAFGGRMDRLRESRLLTATDGAPEDGADVRAHGFTTRGQYRQARRSELHAALALASIPPPAASMLVLASGETVADQTAASHMVAMAHAIRREIEQFRPDAVLTHPYEGGHPDHDSVAFAVHAALRLVPGEAHPLLLEATGYHAGDAWGEDHGGIRTGTFLPPPAAQTPVTRYVLGPQEQANKAALLGCFASQGQTLAQFTTAQELFRPAPRYDFTAAPHGGTLFYEHFPWGMRGSRFRELVRGALLALERR